MKKQSVPFYKMPTEQDLVFEKLAAFWGEMPNGMAALGLALIVGVDKASSEYGLGNEDTALLRLSVDKYHEASNV